MVEAPHSTPNPQWLWFALSYLLLANAPFWAASYWLGLLPLGWFCLEYAAVGILALFLPTGLAAILLVLMMSADVLSAVSKTYYLSPGECLLNAGSLTSFSAARVLVMIMLCGLALSVAVGLSLVKIQTGDRRLRARAAGCLGGFLILGLFIDYCSIVREARHVVNPFRGARPSDENRFSTHKALWFGRYPMLRLARDQRLFAVGRLGTGARLDDQPRAQSAASRAVREAHIVPEQTTSQAPNVVLVVVESWGSEADSRIRESLVRSYERPDLHDRYAVERGVVPFYGSTVGGEIRELCESRAGLEVVNIEKSRLLSCLPYFLGSMGYHSTAMHGMDGGMFGRYRWYRNIGFQDQWFRDRFRSAGLPNCIGAFDGICDTAIATWITRRLEHLQGRPEFVYWVTLNSHLPVPVPSGVTDAPSCSLSPSLSANPAFCSWYQLVYSVHDSISRIAVANLARPTVFVIVGDHAPPFSNPELITQFSRTEVPYLILLPRRPAPLVERLDATKPSGQ